MVTNRWPENSRSERDKGFFFSKPDLPHSLRQSCQQVGCNQRLFSHRLAGDVAGKSVEVDSCDDGLNCPSRVLSHESGDHTGKNVAGAAGCHSGITGRIDPHRSIRLRHEGPMALEHHDKLVLAGEVASDLQTLMLDLCRGLTH